MKFTNSSLVEYTQISPHRSSPRNHAIDTITIHTTGAVTSLETLGRIFAAPNRKASSNYGIDNEGRIGMYCEEKDRSWCSSSSSNDNRAITIEVSATMNKEPYPATDLAMQSLIKLCADICKRNGIKKLMWRNDRTLIGQVEKQNMTVHRWFARKSCLDINTELLTRKGWVTLKDISIEDCVATVDGNNLTIRFDKILDILPIREEPVISINGLPVTKDHMMLFCNGDRTMKSDIAKNIAERYNISIPRAGYYKSRGLDLSDKELSLIAAIISKGSVIIENDSIVGIEFSVTHDCRTAIMALISNYSLMVDSQYDLIKVYDNKLVEFYLKYLDTATIWKLLDLSEEQVMFLLNILLKDIKNFEKKYQDLITALAALNGSSVTIDEGFVFGPPLELIDYDKKESIAQVSCVTVESGFIMVRKNGNTYICGNCPGEYLYNKLSYIAEEVNKMLGVQESFEKDKVPEYKVPNSKSTDIAKTIWDFFKEKGLSDYSIAGLIGNLKAESNLSSINLQNNFEKKLGYDDLSYTQAVDNGTYKNFVEDKAGYGLAQWTYWSRKKALLDYAQQEKCSIGDLEMQLRFLWLELNNNGRLLSLLKAATSVRIASDIILKEFERPADMSIAVQLKRAELGMKYFHLYSEKVKDPDIIKKAPEVIQETSTNVHINEVLSTTTESIKHTFTDSFLKAIIKSIIEIFKNLFGRKEQKESKKDFTFSPYERPANMPPAPRPHIPVEEFEFYPVKILKTLNVRKGPGVKYAITGVLRESDVYTIVEEKMNGTTKWGKLKSGAGWISLSFAKRVK